MGPSLPSSVAERGASGAWFGDPVSHRGDSASAHIVRANENRSELIRQKRHGYRGQLRLRDHGILIRDQAGRLCLYKNLNEVFYDDTAGSNPLFHDKLKLVVLGDGHRGLCNLLDISELSETTIFYNGSRNGEFEEFDDLENSLTSDLKELRPLLFAFLVHSDTSPIHQRLVLDSDQFNARWDSFGSLKVEVVEQLSVTIDTRWQQTSWSIPDTFSVVLEDASRQGRKGRRLFVRTSHFDREGRFAHHLLATPLASLLGINVLLLRFVAETIFGGWEGRPGNLSAERWRYSSRANEGFKAP